jgi:hypothetical protein
MKVTLVVALLLAACKGGERDATAAAVKETYDAVRPKQLVVVKVRDEDVALRNAIEDQLVAQRVGTVVERAAGAGFVSLSLEVESTADAVPRVRAILRELDLLEKTSVEIRQQ